MNSKTQILDELRESCKQFSNIGNTQSKKEYTSPTIHILGEVKRLTTGGSGAAGFDVFTGQPDDLS